MRCIGAESRAGKFAMSIATSMILEEVVMDEPLTLSGSRKRKNTVEEDDRPSTVGLPYAMQVLCASFKTLQGEQPSCNVHDASKSTAKEAVPPRPAASYRILYSIILTKTLQQSPCSYH